MRSRMRNLYRRILASNPHGEQFFDMENESGRCLVSKKYEPHDRVDDVDEKCGDRAARAITGKHRDKGIYIPTEASVENEAAFDSIIPEDVNITPPLPGEDTSIPIATVAVANRLQTSGSCRQSSMIPSTTAKRLPTPVISNELQDDKDLSLCSSSPPCNEGDKPNATTKTVPNNEKMLSKRNTVPKSKLKKTRPARCTFDDQRSTGKQTVIAAMKTSDLYSHVQNLPVLKKVAV
ncbi:uncharacterized protein LOC121409010 [Lytechinus variegatus]|uniref:uncharacterized protein LOC121409010 n=1 Tax=Lytechinus variegatus TaxID=7654 RepID=UPI001BB21CD3|nr:uncharacterized protein LOC121409010 [Lytechinus variegatus]